MRLVYFMEIAIDGFSACGKSTLAKSLAKELDALYIDTGAMYRALTLYFLNHNIDINTSKDIIKALKSIEITFEAVDGVNHCFLNGNDVEREIRDPEVSDFVSEVAAISAVRKKMVDLQRRMSESKDVVMDGRDIGTVVFPHAKYKFFITADPLVRAKRRLLEYREKGVDVDMEEVIKNLEKRDHIDSTRSDSPLKKADDAILIDNSDLTRREQLEIVLSYINEPQ